MEYEATFGIDGGVFPGFGIVYPDEQRVISADNYQSAYQKAMDLAGNIQNDYLSAPNSDFVTVSLSSLTSLDDDVSFDASKAVVKKRLLDHIAWIASLEDKMRDKSSE